MFDKVPEVIMKSATTHLKYLVFVCIYCFATFRVAWADDTEIFFSTSNTTPVNPNILFVVDTSGSMAWDLTGISGQYPHSGSWNPERQQSRITVVKDALSEMINSLSNINAGLARFSVPGGPILFPVTDIDAAADPQIIKSIESGNNDSEETLGSGNILLTGSHLDMETDQIVGLRYEDIIIPQGALINSATLTFSSSRTDNVGSDYLISGEDVDNSSVFTGSNFDLSGRTKTSKVTPWHVSGLENWLSPTTNANGDIVTSSHVTSDIKDVVQEIIDRPGWCGGNALSLFVNTLASPGTHSAITFENNPDLTPILKISYSKTAVSTVHANNGCVGASFAKKINRRSDDFEFKPNGSMVTRSNQKRSLEMMRYNNQTQDGVGLIFRDIIVPQNARITEAYVVFEANGYNQHTSTTLTVDVINSSNAKNLSKNNWMSHSVVGPSFTWTPGSWTHRQKYSTREPSHANPDLAQQIEAVVNRSDWDSGDSIGIRISGSGLRRAYSYDGRASRAAELVIKYQGAATTTTSTATVRQELLSKVSSLNATGSTPIADTLLEAGLYFNAKNVLYGRVRGAPSSQYDRVSHPWSHTGSISYPSSASATYELCGDSNSSSCRTETVSAGARYLSPIKDECQANHIVFLTDGAPNGMSSLTPSTFTSVLGGGNCHSHESCAKKIAAFLRTNDNAPTVSGQQKVITHTIGFAFNSQFLDDLATEGGGNYYTTNTKDGLLAAFQDVVATVIDVNATFVTAGVTVNQYNRLTHSDELYFSLFEPGNTNRWPGNIKRYELNSSGVVVDQNSAAAVDGSNGEFKETAQSFWSNIVDGNEVNLGGAGENLPLGRILYTNVTSSDITDSSNQVLPSNANVINYMTIPAVVSERRKTIDWARGFDVDGSVPTSPHGNFGQPLHSRPTIVSYEPAIAGNPLEPVVFVGTNEGFVSSINTESGVENWAFIPKEKLDNLNDYREDSVLNTNPIYGVDGNATIYIQDDNGDGVIARSGETAYLYIGMRRGGNKYYAFDITDKDDPELEFVIDGDDPSSSYFGKLGQTWSQPRVGKMKFNGSVRSVLIFGGGYDTDQDNYGGTNNDNVGNRVLIANAETGALLWDSYVDAGTPPTGAGAATTMNSVPGDVTAFDLDDDGLLDHIYAVDTRAQIFRFDIDNTFGTITGGRIAALQNDASETHNRRFYYAPDVALIRDSNTGERYMTISVGSGYRAHPLDTNVQERMYVVQDKGVLSTPAWFDIGPADLVDVSNTFGDTDGDGISDAAEAINSSNSHGWYIDFNSIGGTGEKVLATSTTFGGRLLFTTYLPPTSSLNASGCAPSAGSSRVYAVNIEDGTPAVDTNYNGSLNDASDRFIGVPGAGIAPEPQILITNNGTRLIVGRNTGTAFNDLLPQIPEGLIPKHWYHEPTTHSSSQTTPAP